MVSKAEMVAQWRSTANGGGGACGGVSGCYWGTRLRNKGKEVENFDLP